MREIKFRAWKSNYEVMVNCDNLCLAHYNINDMFRGADDYVFMQYTGLKDKNGVEIYEGDIIQEGRYTHFIKYEDNCFSTFEINGKLQTQKIYNKTCEVIGNIYENPELLKD